MEVVSLGESTWGTNELSLAARLKLQLSPKDINLAFPCSMLLLIKRRQLEAIPSRGLSEGAETAPAEEILRLVTPDANEPAIRGVTRALEQGHVHAACFWST